MAPSQHASYTEIQSVDEPKKQIFVVVVDVVENWSKKKIEAVTTVYCQVCCEKSAENKFIRSIRTSFIFVTLISLFVPWSGIVLPFETNRTVNPFDPTVYLF